YKTWTPYGGRSSLFDSLLNHMSSVFPDQVVRRGRAADMPDNHLVKVCQLAVMQQISEFKYHNPNARVPDDFFASILTDVFTYKKSADGRPSAFPPDLPVSQSMPAADNGTQWVLDPVEGGGGSRQPVNLPSPTRKAAPPMKAVEEAQGFYGLPEPGAPPGGEEKYDRFAPPMEVEHFPPATIKPPVKWEINLDDDGAIIDDSKEKEEEPQLSPEEEAALLEREREEELRVEKERLEQLQTQFPPVNPEDPYAHPETRDSFLQFHPLCTMQESHPIRTVSFSPYGEAFCVGTNSKALRICKLAPDGDAIEVLHERANHHKGSVYCSSWNCESRLVATGSNDKTVKVVKVFLEDEGTGAGIVSNSIEQNDLVLKGHGGTVRDVQFHKEDSNRLLSVGAHDNLCLVWDIVGTAADNVEPIRSLSDHTETVFCGRFNPFDTNLVATGGADNTVKIWDLRSLDFTQSSTTANTPSAVLSLLWSDRHTVVTSHADGSIRETDVRTGRERSVIQAHQDECRSLDATPCGRFLCTGGFDGLSSIFSMDAEAPDFVGSLRMRSGGRILSAKFRPRGEQGVLVAGADCSVTYWGARPKQQD
ncbi:hypothetical protein TeGR_g12954, partial [Tetraparma gracilis]